jgi:hypothetical protein
MFASWMRAAVAGRRPGRAGLRTAVTTATTLKSIKGKKSITANCAEAATTDR